MNQFIQPQNQQRRSQSKNENHDERPLQIGNLISSNNNRSHNF